jgi:hypothetical protein
MREFGPEVDVQIDAATRDLGPEIEQAIIEAMTAIDVMPYPFVHPNPNPNPNPNPLPQPRRR